MVMGMRMRMDLGREDVGKMGGRCDARGRGGLRVRLGDGGAAGCGGW